ncbi:hypothetical protein [Sodalis sp.]|uniref:hypothetical protein n=1 Tax=Sodalis sp. (in: enterobacteria) TaxID=1898979 RepID=UPI003873CB99
MQGNGSLIIAEPTVNTLLAPSDGSNLEEVISQQQARRALEITLASSYNLFRAAEHRENHAGEIITGSAAAGNG